MTHGSPQTQGTGRVKYIHGTVGPSRDPLLWYDSIYYKKRVCSHLTVEFFQVSCGSMAWIRPHGMGPTFTPNHRTRPDSALGTAGDQLVLSCTYDTSTRTGPTTFGDFTQCPAAATH